MRVKEGTPTSAVRAEVDGWNERQETAVRCTFSEIRPEKTPAERCYDFRFGTFSAPSCDATSSAADAGFTFVSMARIFPSAPM